MRRGMGIGLAIVAVSLLGGCARGTVQDALGMGKRAPDEFAVVKRAPLIVPPDFDLRPPDPGAPRPQIGRTSDQARVALTGTRPEVSPAGQVLAGARPSPTSNQTSAVPGSVPAAAIADDLLSAGTNAPTNTAGAALPAPDVTNTASDTTLLTSTTRETPGEQAMVALAGGDQSTPDIRRVIAEENQDLADVEASLFTKVVKWRDPATMGATIDAPAEAERLRNNRIAGRTATEGDTPTVINRRQSALQGFLKDIF